MRWLSSLLLNAVLFLFLAWLFSNSFHVEDFGAALVASFLLAIVNVLVRPIVKILTLPLNILTLGLFTFVVNAMMLLLVNRFMGETFHIDGFGTALMMAIMMAFLNMILNATILKGK